MIPQHRIVVRVMGADLNSRRGFQRLITPYCVVSCGLQSFRTRTVHESGNNPRWGEQFVFTGTPADVLRFEVRDRNHFSSDKLMGGVILPVESIVRSGAQNGFLPLSRGGKHKGGVMIEAQIDPTYGTGSMYTSGFAPQPVYAAPQPQYVQTVTASYPPLPIFESGQPPYVAGGTQQYTYSSYTTY